jgi:integrase
LSAVLILNVTKERLELTPAIYKYCDDIDKKSTRKMYSLRLHHFHRFLQQKYNISIDDFVDSFKVSPQKYNLYDVMCEYRKSQRDRLANNTIAARIAAARGFLEYNDVPINNAKWRGKVKPPKLKHSARAPMSKENIRNIILGCQSPRLRTYIQTLAATGCRPQELAKVLRKNLDLENRTIYIRAEDEKMEQDRYVFLTKECVEQLKNWIEHRNRVRRFVNRETKGHYIVTHKSVPLTENTPLFSTGRHDATNDVPSQIYAILAKEFRATLKRMKLDVKTEDGKRNKITLHKFRKYVKTTISNLGHHSFSEYFIGHKNSTYWDATDEEKQRIYHIVEPYLTYLDYSELEANGADLQTQLEQSQKEIEQLKQQLKEREFDTGQLEDHVSHSQKEIELLKKQIGNMQYANQDVEKIRKDMREELEQFKENLRKAVIEQYKIST